ncbi:MAG: peptide-methionine (S)-S-oxide reductase MsrA [Sulfurovaceae bacterium]|nr:peptide-methionine (S)-S-oxide reductase MsrA [Sulfurovaceae bacterium]
MIKLFLLLALSSSLFSKTQTIVFGAGCFWGVEKHFESLEGVIKATSGYAGGDYANPTYKMVLKHRNESKKLTNHTEAVEVVYDDGKISTKTLIESFWELHDPTQGERQGNDKGNNYRSALYCSTDTQKALAESTKEVYQKLLTKAGYGMITTKIKTLKKFYKAENYHQNYLEKNPRGYCPNHSTGVKFVAVDVVENSISPFKGKEIVVIEAKHCNFCEKFKKDISSKYRGTIPLRTAKESQLKGFNLNSKIVATPTILFIEDGKEIHAHIGYMNEKSFYRAIGEFKLGTDSKAFDVAFNQHTDGRLGQFD